MLLAQAWQGVSCSMGMRGRRRMRENALAHTVAVMPHACLPVAGQAPRPGSGVGGRYLAGCGEEFRQDAPGRGISPQQAVQNVPGMHRQLKIGATSKPDATEQPPGRTDSLGQGGRQTSSRLALHSPAAVRKGGQQACFAVPVRKDERHRKGPPPLHRPDSSLLRR